MQAEGDVIRFPREAEAPPDFTAFFAEEHRGLFKALYFVTGNRADAQELTDLGKWREGRPVDRERGRKRPPAAGQLLFPRWSPDGTRIAYADEGDSRTYVFDVATGVTTSIAGVASWPEWVDDDTLLLG